MAKILSLTGILLNFVGCNMIHFLKLSEAKKIKENAHEILDKYEDDDIVSDEDFEKIMHPLGNIKLRLIIGLIFIVLGAILSVVGIFLR